MMASCQKDELEISNSDQSTVSPYDASVISLEVGVDSVSTRAYKVETPEKMETVGIFAAHHTDGLSWSSDGEGDVDFDKMDNERLTYSQGLWLYDGDAIKWGWESLSDKYTFFGYSPYGTGSTEDGGNGIAPAMDSKGRLVIDYQVSEDCTQQFDLTVAAKTNLYYPSMGSVTLEFDHALSMIGFQVVNKQGFPNPNKRIKQIKIMNVASKGTLTFDGDTMDWSYSDPAEFTAAGNLRIAPTNTAQEVTTDGNYLMMIPQTFEQATEVVVTLSHELGGCIDLESFYIPAGTTWEAGQSYSYIIEDDSYIISERNGASNCYMIHPDEAQVYYIPIDGRINEFWDEYAGEEQFLISDAIGLGAEIIWHDCLYPAEIEKVSFEFIDEYTTGSESLANLRHGSGVEITAAHHPNYVTDKSQVVMKVTVPSGMSGCNISVAVWRDMDGSDERDTEYAYDDDGELTAINEILWSWHLWVTDYNPDDNVGTLSPTTYEYAVTDGEIHKYSDNESGLLDGATAIWGDKLTTGGTAIYQNKCIMDRHIGAYSDEYTGMGGTTYGKGFVVYQYGRKDPFPSTSSSTFPNSAIQYLGSSGVRVSFADAVHSPATFYGGVPNWCDQSIDAAYSLKLLWNDMKVNNPNTPTEDHKGVSIEKYTYDDLAVTDEYALLNLTKSIFDPSPLGWRLPIAGVWSDLTVDVDAEGTTNFNRTYTGDGDATIVYYRTYDLNGAIYPMSGFIEHSVREPTYATEYGHARTASPSIQNKDYDWYDDNDRDDMDYTPLEITDFAYIMTMGRWGVSNDYSYLRSHGMPARAIQE